MRGLMSPHLVPLSFQVQIYTYIYKKQNKSRKNRSNELFCFPFYLTNDILVRNESRVSCSIMPVTTSAASCQRFEWKVRR